MGMHASADSTASLRVQKVQLIIFAVVVALYINSMTGELLFDDNEAIVTNRDVRPTTPLKYIFINDFWGVPVSSNDSHKSYRPLTVLTFRWNFALHGLHPWGYHLFNVILHGFVSVLFFDLCVLLFGGQLAPALVGGLLFAVHPIHTEAVSSVVGRAELLAALFYLLSFRSYVKAVQQSNDFRAERFSYGLLGVSVILCGISALCKETGITVLAACVTYDLVYVCHLSGWDVLSGLLHPSTSACKWLTHSKWLKPLLKRLLLLAASLSVFLILRIYLLAGGTATSFVESDNPTLFESNFWTRLRTYTYLCALNVWSLLCPSALCYDWSMDSIPRIKDNMDSRNIMTLSVAFTLLCLVYYGLFGSNYFTSDQRCIHNSKRQGLTVEGQAKFPEMGTLMNRNGASVISVMNGNGHMHMLHEDEVEYDGMKELALTNRRQILTMALCLMVAPFIPASNLFFPVGFVLAERVLYLPSMGYCIIVALGLRVFMHKADMDQTNNKVARFWVAQMKLHSGLRVLFCGLLFVCSAKAIQRNFDWVSTESLATAGLQVNPNNAKIHLTMGNVLANKGLRKCEQFYRQAIQLRPQYTAAWTNLGLVLLNTGRPEEAEKAYLEALRLKPNSADANTNMGHLCRIQERWTEADFRYRSALKKRPYDPTLHYNLALVNEKLNQLEVAEVHYQHVLSVEPNNKDAGFAFAHLTATTNTKHARLSEGKMATGKRFKQAEKAYRTALHYHPNHEDGLLQFGKLLLWNERIDESELQFRHATRINPNLIDAHFYLGQALEKKRLPNEAVKAYQRAVHVDKTYQPALLSLKRLDTSGMS